MAKKKSKKGNKPKNSKKETSQSNVSLNDYLVYGGIALIAIVALLFLIVPRYYDTDTDQEIDDQIAPDDDVDLDPSEVLAKVEGEEITRGEVEEMKMIFQQQTGQEVGDRGALENLIMENLLVREAKEEVEMTDEQFEEDFEEMFEEMVENVPEMEDMTLEEYKQQIETMGHNMDDVRENLIFSKFSEEMPQEEIQALALELKDEADVEIYEERLEEAPTPQIEIGDDEVPEDMEIEIE